MLSKKSTPFLAQIFGLTKIHDVLSRKSISCQKPLGVLNKNSTVVKLNPSKGPDNQGPASTVTRVPNFLVIPRIIAKPGPNRRRNDKYSKEKPTLVPCRLTATTK